MIPNEQDFFVYKGKPLIKNKNIIYYGSLLDDFVVMLQIVTEKKVDEEMVPDTILVQLMKTDRNLKPQDMVVKKSEKHGMYPALEIAEIWLTRALAQK